MNGVPDMAKYMPNADGKWRDRFSGSLRAQGPRSSVASPGCGLFSAGATGQAVSAESGNQQVITKLLVSNTIAGSGEEGATLRITRLAGLNPCSFRTCSAAVP